MKSAVLAILLIGLMASASAEVYFRDEFDSGITNWIPSDWKDADSATGKFEWSAGQYFKDAEEDKGLRTSEDYRFFTASAKFDDFSNKDKKLIIQYSVKHEQNIDCGGAYIKLYPAGTEQEHLNGDSKYNVMFGPDICGPSNRRVHVIFEHNGQNHLIKKTIAPETDVFTHLYTLIITPDNKYEVRIDGETKAEGSLAEDWDILPSKEILDPEAKKPADWVDDKEIDDPEDVKPSDWEDQPAEIVDPEADKPDDWDDELDGDWEAPTIANPAYKGPWSARKIPNPAYKGVWEHPKIANPDFHDDPTLYAYDSFGLVGIEVWQVKSGTIFDNFLITDDQDEADKYVAVIAEQRAAEKEAKEAEDAEKRKQAEAAAAAKKDSEDSDDDEDMEPLSMDDLDIQVTPEPEENSKDEL
jgi:calreticulin